MPLGSHSSKCKSMKRVPRSEEHTSELQSQSNLVCRLLLEKKKTDIHNLLPYLARDRTAAPLTGRHPRLVSYPHPSPRGPLGSFWRLSCHAAPGSRDWLNRT